MTNSQNGYKAGDTSLIGSYTVPGTDVRINLRKGDVSVVLLDFAQWYNENIEKLRQADTGGYNYRPIAGSKTVSNHGSGTAEDLRWNDHPLGAVGTFSAAEAAKIRARLKYYEGVIRWGGDYSGRKDEMHFEINKGPSDVTRIASKIRADRAPQRIPTMIEMTVKLPDLKEGDDDAKLAGYNTIARMQQLAGVPADGVWGPVTTHGIAARTGLSLSQCKRTSEQLYNRLFGFA